MLMKMQSYSKKKLKGGMTKEFKNMSLKSESMFFCTTLVSDSLKENSSPNGRTLCHRGGLPVWSHQNKTEGTNPKVVNGQRVKHYISGMPINVESNIIQNLTPEEYIKESFRTEGVLD